VALLIPCERQNSAIETAASGTARPAISGRAVVSFSGAPWLHEDGDGQRSLEIKQSEGFERCLNGMNGLNGEPPPARNRVACPGHIELGPICGSALTGASMMCRAFRPLNLSSLER